MYDDTDSVGCLILIVMFVLAVVGYLVYLEALRGGFG